MPNDVAPWPPCVRCGYCCTIRACQHGSWDHERGRCVFLTSENLCARHDEIIAIEQGGLYSMFYGGCSSPMFNVVRDAKIRALTADPTGKKPLGR